MATTITLSGTSDREAIVDALYRAVIAFDTNDFELFKSAWLDSDDIVFEMSPGKRYQGMDAIYKGVFELVGPLDTTHFVSNVRVDHKEGVSTARLTSTTIAQHYRTGEGLVPDAPRLLSGSFYTCDVVKDEKDGIWKLSVGSMKLVWIEGDASIVVKPE